MHPVHAGPISGSAAEMQDQRKKDEGLLFLDVGAMSPIAFVPQPKLPRLEVIIHTARDGRQSAAGPDEQTLGSVCAAAMSTDACHEPSGPGFTKRVAQHSRHERFFSVSSGLFMPMCHNTSKPWRGVYSDHQFPELVRSAPRASARLLAFDDKADLVAKLTQCWTGCGKIARMRQRVIDYHDHYLPRVLCSQVESSEGRR